MLTQKELSHLADVSVNTISSAEQSPTCNINANSLRRLCAALQLSREKMQELWATKRAKPDPDRPAGVAEISYRDEADPQERSERGEHRPYTGIQPRPEVDAQEKKSD